MNILLVTDHYPPTVNGIVRHVLLIKSELEKRGHTVYILTAGFGKRTPEKNVFNLPYLFFPLRKIDPLVIPYRKKIEQKLMDLPIDIVHNHLFFAGFMGLRIAKRKQIPALVTLHTLFQTYTSWILPFPNLWYPAVDVIARNYFNKHDGVVAPSTKAFDELKRLKITSDFRLIYNGINLPDPGKVDEEFFYKTYHIKKEDPLIAMVGRVDPGKNVDFAVKAVYKVREKIPNVRLAIIGDGELMEPIKALVQELKMEENVIMTGFVDQKMVAAANKAADFELFTSNSDTLPTVLIEAMSLKKPIVAVKDPAIVDLAEDGKNGLITSRNQTDLAHAIEKLITDKTLAKKYGEESFAASQKFSIKNHVDNIEKYYHDLIALKTSKIRPQM